MSYAFSATLGQEEVELSFLYPSQTRQGAVVKMLALGNHGGQRRGGRRWVSQQGLEFSRSLSGEGSHIFLVSWSSVLLLNVRPRGELEEEARERFTIDRQSLLDRLGDPQPEDTTLNLDARRYLSYNANDEEVRQALARLPRERLYP